jgi:non-heme chloroperoxidase
VPRAHRRALGVTVPEAELRQIFNTAPNGSVGAPRTPPGYTDALVAGMQKYTDLRAPVLAIFAIPADLGPWMNRDDAKTRDALDAYLALAEKQAKAFEMGVPTARVVRLAYAKHMIFESNEADVLREMGAFLSSLR